ncbi:MAG TPA: BatD family protein, partial [Pseudomonas sp.]|nr:BatD family protein [Pseudomonas sp.]
MMRTFALLCLLLLSGVARGDTLLASVDRQQVTEGDSVELTLELSGLSLTGQPDLTPLLPLFEVLDSRQVNRVIRDAQGSRNSTRWILTLMPRRTGYVVIPQLRVGEAVSAPITLQVSEASTPSAAETRAMPVFIDASLDRDTLYVQSQALLTLRIFHSVSLFDDSTLTPLQTPEARIEQLGKPRTYETRINGVRHGVIEVRYAIHPLRSGELELPAQVFSATLVERSDPDTFNPFGPRTGRSVQVSSPVIPLNVRPIPAEYPVDTPWLPATSLTLEEHWSEASEPLKVGDSLTRSLTLRAEGLAGTQLPPLPLAEMPGLRRYPDQPKLESRIGETGLTGVREQRAALVPTQAGDLDIPALE